jgi:AcrR family transcriptional regulator
MSLRNSATADPQADAPAARGRPRDSEIDARVLDATVALLAERGFAETTVQAIARRAGVGPPAIYRRWSSRIDLIEHAVFPAVDAVAIRATGDLRADIQRYVDAYTDAYRSPAARAAVPALLSIYQSDGDARRRLPRHMGQSVRRDFHAMLRAAPPHLVDPAVDPHDVLDMLIGAVIYRVFMFPFSGRTQSDGYITDLLLRAVCPLTERNDRGE